MKYLTNRINWDRITHVGFDLDGTLYDEYEFIEQAYDHVLESWGIISPDNLMLARHFMRNRWIEKGSSFPFIFDETIDFLNLNNSSKEELVKIALKAYRNCDPILHLPHRINHILSTLSPKVHLFMVTDGQSDLQRKKISALAINQYFESTQIYISGDFGKEYHKPNIHIVNKFDFDLKLINPERIIYIGDRLKDQEFAQNAGMQFCFIHQLFNQL